MIFFSSPPLEPWINNNMAGKNQANQLNNQLCPAYESTINYAPPIPSDDPANRYTHTIFK